MFEYPLTRQEIFRFLFYKHREEDVSCAIHNLVTERRIYQLDKFYSLRNDHLIIAERRKVTMAARKFITKASARAKWLIRLPFVRGVGVSGTFHKNLWEERADADMLIITSKNRLWIARMLVNCYRLFAFPKQENALQLSYYIDEQELELRDKNLHTAVAINMLVPLEGDITFEKFYAANAWVRSYLPNKLMRVSSATPLSSTICKLWFEKLFDNRAGNKLDNFLMRISAWCKQKGLPTGMLAGQSNWGKHFKKPEHAGFSYWMEQRYNEKVIRLIGKADHRIAQ
ncbi:hypothetical protein DYU05_14045 [Mucilaginibacter terrenus]|uniref:Nucleotidyltransferase domain-containing protein n=2 Tax=Mucilaginibacter terrenus TaxID=2482727 RepID=A0A3E2NQI8_9SPHI|nr:hypothetical protein DYU05_14045 [Mucilaginibacter terrenus]